MFKEDHMIISLGYRVVSAPQTNISTASYTLMRISAYLPKKKIKTSDFLLGSVAPDAVHFHNEYDVSLKERSHLWKFGPRWGITLDSEGWLDVIYKFWKENRKSMMWKPVFAVSLSDCSGIFHFRAQ